MTLPFQSEHFHYTDATEGDDEVFPSSVLGRRHLFAAAAQIAVRMPFGRIQLPPLVLAEGGMANIRGAFVKEDGRLIRPTSRVACVLTFLPGKSAAQGSSAFLATRMRGDWYWWRFLVGDLVTDIAPAEVEAPTRLYRLDLFDLADEPTHFDDIRDAILNENCRMRHVGIGTWTYQPCWGGEE